VGDFHEFSLYPESVNKFFTVNCEIIDILYMNVSSSAAVTCLIFFRMHVAGYRPNILLKYNQLIAPLCDTKILFTH